MYGPFTIYSPTMTLPAELFIAIFTTLQDQKQYQTLATCLQCSREVANLVAPILYERVELDKDEMYETLMRLITDSHEQASTRQHLYRINPQSDIKSLVISHFPSTSICARIQGAAQDQVLLPTVRDIIFVRSCCPSMLWGPIQLLHNPQARTQIQNFASIASPRHLCVHLTHHSVFDQRWNRIFNEMTSSWKSLVCINIHGFEYRLKCFKSGVLHRLFLDFQGAPYRPGTGSTMLQGSRDNYEKYIDAWAEVLLEMIVDAVSQEERKGYEGTKWELHCPGARMKELEDASVRLKHMLMRSSPMSARLEGKGLDEIMSFVADAQIPCQTCSGKQVIHLMQHL